MFEQTPIQSIRVYIFGLVCEMVQLMPNDFFEAIYDYFSIVQIDFNFT